MKLRRMLVTLAGCIGLVVPITTVVTTVETQPASAAQYCPNPFYYNCGFSGWMRWITCGPYVYNPYIGYFIDRCGYILV